MDEREFVGLLDEVLQDSGDQAVEDEGEGRDELAGVRTSTFAEAGLLTSSEGLVVTLRDGSQWQVTVVQRQAAR